MSFQAVDNLSPVHPGEFLADELQALDFSARRFAAHISVPPNAVTEILNGDRRITAPMALRLGRAFRTAPAYWLNLQNLYDLKIALVEHGNAVATIQPLREKGEAA